MKIVSTFILLAFLTSPNRSTNLIHTSIKASITSPCGNTPELNKKIIDFVNSKINKKVGRGECWDLAAEALNSTGAIWDKNFKFGKEIDIKKDCVFPGDIVQFTDVAIEYTLGNRTYTETMAQHTAIIFEVKGSGDYTIADQNTTAHGKKVGLGPLKLKNISTGKTQVYRPTS